MEESALTAKLAEAWEIDVPALAYLPMGAGSYHWSGVDSGGQAWFVTVDDLGVAKNGRARRFEGLGQAFGTAVALRRDAGLEFVVAPVPDRNGFPVVRLDGRYAVSLFPVVDGVAGAFGEHRAEDKAEVLKLLIELHRAKRTTTVPASRIELRLPGRDALEAALNDLEKPWTGGPFAEPARELLTKKAGYVTQLLGEFDRLAEQVRNTVPTWVITHGEPHPGNLLRNANGLHLIDWETVRIAPPERDLWMLADDGILTEYTQATGHQVTREGLDLFRLWWEANDIAIFVEELRRPHHATEDITASWTYLNSYFN
ncbi:phosphotransferase [Acrocarpospora catenulata]|uniref:phosphotransferase n=1 Tax=Acrocarpospora catenulata TaxID=2836182 RepID=UPI0027DEE814|nr:phosphotransferase [Acrocarpospora catenulata]